MLNLTFNFQPYAKIPLYRQLYTFIKGEITEGKLAANEVLPSTRGLAQHLGVSRNTVESAYAQLVAEGYIKAKPKSGHIVCKLEGMVGKNKAAALKKDKVYNSQPQEQNYKYDFKTNAVDLASFPFALWAKISREIIHDKNRELLKLTHPQGDYTLRATLAKYLHSFRGVNCSAEQIIIGAGTEYLLSLLFQILGDNAVYAIENPGYFKVYNILGSYKKKVNLIGLDNEGIDITSLEQTNSNVVYVTPSHHFPLGTIMPASRRLQLLAWASKSADNYIIEDDYDSEFRFVGHPIPALQGLKESDKVIYISTFSKTIAPSIRASYMVLPHSLQKRYQEHFLFYSSTVPRFEQYTLNKFIQNGHFERHLNKMRNIYKSRKDALVDTIKQSPFGCYIDIIGADAGLHLLLKIHSTKSEQELLKLAQSVNIKLYGLSEYYLSPTANMPNNIVVLGYAHLTPQEIKEAVSLLLAVWFN